MGVTIVVVVLLYLVNKLFRNNEKVKKVKEYIFAKLFFNAVIRLFIQSYLTICLASYFNVMKLF